MGNNYKLKNIKKFEELDWSSPISELPRSFGFFYLIGYPILSYGINRIKNYLLQGNNRRHVTDMTMTTISDIDLDCISIEEFKSIILIKDDFGKKEPSFVISLDTDDYTISVNDHKLGSRIGKSGEHLTEEPIKIPKDKFDRIVEEIIWVKSVKSNIEECLNDLTDSYFKIEGMRLISPKSAHYKGLDQDPSITITLSCDIKASDGRIVG